MSREDSWYELLDANDEISEINKKAKRLLGTNKKLNILFIKKAWLISLFFQILLQK